MDARHPKRAADTELIRRLDAEWRVLVRSRWLRERLQSCAPEDPRLAFADGIELAAAAQRRDASSWGERDQVLAALLERAQEDALARRVALQVVLPGVKSLIDRTHAWDVEERAARVVATAVEVLAWYASELALTSPSFRAYVNTRRRVLRAAIRDRSEPVVLVDDFSHFHAGDDPLESRTNAGRFDDLVEWVRQRGRVREDTARLVLLTQAAGVSVDDLASVESMNPQTLRQRRLRAERRVRESLAVAP